MLILELLFYQPIIIVTNNNLSLVRNIFLLTKFNYNLSIAFRFNKFISPSARESNPVIKVMSLSSWTKSSHKSDEYGEGATLISLPAWVVTVFDAILIGTLNSYCDYCHCYKFLQCWHLNWNDSSTIPCVSHWIESVYLAFLYNCQITLPVLWIILTWKIACISFFHTLNFDSFLCFPIQLNAVKYDLSGLGGTQ